MPTTQKKPEIDHTPPFIAVTPPPLSNQPPARNRRIWLWIIPALVILVGILFIINLAVNKSAAGTSKTASISTNGLKIGSTQTSAADGMQQVYVPAGDFIMGSEESKAYANERPQHTVTLDAFWIDKTEVTNAMYEKCVVAKVCTNPDSEVSYTRKKYYGNDNYTNYPVVHVTWNQAKQYCEWAGRALPTEAQWEKAARGTDGRTYPWGSDAPSKDIVNYNGNLGDTQPVGSYTAGASHYGALDMDGNVWEWVADNYDSQYYDSSPASNPTGPTSGTYHIIRGGSWYNLALDIRTSVRLAVNPAKTYYDTGFRCASSAK